MDSLVLKSPAKLNLYLDVIRKRPDGYHDIETVFEKIALFDILTIRPRKKGIVITSNDPGLPADNRNLAYKAARLLFRETGFKNGVLVDINKNIPVCAGLGGGSSNAASTLLGINRLFQLGLTKRDLIGIGKKIGADVPFFLYDSCFGIGCGRGDKILSINRYINIWHIIVSFNFGVSTKKIYESLSPFISLRANSMRLKALNLGLTPARPDVKMCLPSILKNDIENLGVSLYNRLEEVAFKRFGIIKAVKALLLKEGAYGAVLSGSGPTIFGITKTREEAMGVKARIQRKLNKQGCKILVVETMKGV
jgi:4-diphosphocytidyl-2-C-methyl-D-erythritol kinase